MGSPANATAIAFTPAPMLTGIVYDCVATPAAFVAALPAAVPLILNVIVFPPIGAPSLLCLKLAESEIVLPRAAETLDDESVVAAARIGAFVRLQTTATVCAVSSSVARPDDVAVFVNVIGNRIAQAVTHRQQGVQINHARGRSAPRERTCREYP